MEHGVKICRLYRRALRWCFDWHSGIDSYRGTCLAVRAEFERHRHEKDPNRIELLYLAGDYCLWKWENPEPYKCMFRIARSLNYSTTNIDPSAPGGVAYMREPIYSKEVIFETTVSLDYSS